MASLLSSCMPLQGSILCEEVREDALRKNLSFGVTTMPEVREWVSTTFPVDGTSVMEQQDELSWSLRNRSFSARFEDGVLMRVITDWSAGPTVQQVLDCLGTPEYYEAVIRPDIKPRFDLVLWYPGQGLVGDSSSFGRDSVAPPDVTWRRRMGGFIVTKPGTLEDVVSTVYNYRSIKEVPDELLSTIKPWPGSLDQIVVDNLLLK